MKAKETDAYRTADRGVLIESRLTSWNTVHQPERSNQIRFLPAESKYEHLLVQFRNRSKML